MNVRTGTGLFTDFIKVCVLIIVLAFICSSKAAAHFNPGDRAEAAVTISCPDFGICSCVIPQGTQGTVLCYDAEDAEYPGGYPYFVHWDNGCNPYHDVDEGEFVDWCAESDDWGVWMSSDEITWIGPPCDSSHLDLCTSPSDCASAGGKWVAGTCITRPAIIRTTSAHTCDGVHHVFTRSADNHLLESWWTWNDGWNISDLTAISWGKEISDVPSSFTDNGVHHVFARGVDGHLYDWWWTWNDKWNISVLMENLCQKDPDYDDNDGDGYSENQGDCNDNDQNIHPNATEICGDGIDQDCWEGDSVCPNGNCDLYIYTYDMLGFVSHTSVIAGGCEYPYKKYNLLGLVTKECVCY